MRISKRRGGYVASLGFETAIGKVLADEVVLVKVLVRSSFSVVPLKSALNPLPTN